MPSGWTCTTLAFLLMLSFLWILKRRNPHVVARNFRMLQTVSAAALALGLADGVGVGLGPVKSGHCPGKKLLKIRALKYAFDGS